LPEAYSGGSNLKKGILVDAFMDGAVSNTHRSLTLVSGEAMGENAEEPGSSSANGDKRCGRHKVWRPLKSALTMPEVWS